MLWAMTLHSTDPTLYALFCLRRQTLPVHSGSLSRLTGRSAEQVALDLMQLEDRGLASADQARLTMLGLARAAQLARAIGDSPQLQQKPRGRVQRIKPPVAAARQCAASERADADDGDSSIPPALSA
jgi:hypothetical protein